MHEFIGLTRRPVLGVVMCSVIGKSAVSFADARSVESHYRLVFDNTSIVIEDTIRNEKRVLYGKGSAVEEDDCLTNNTYKAVSVVGDLLTVWESSAWQCGAHPSAWQTFSMYSIANPHATPSILDYFDESDVVATLLTDKVVQRHLSPNSNPQTLEDLQQAVKDDSCAINFETLGNNFAFHSVKGDTVAVRFGLGYGCGASSAGSFSSLNNGRFTQLGVYLPISEALKKDLDRAEKQGLLMSTLDK